MDRSSFPFSLELSYQREPPKPRPGGLPRLVVKLSQKPLAVPAFTVQNGRAKSWVTLCSTTVDRAEISRINGRLVDVNSAVVPGHAVLCTAGRHCGWSAI